MMVIQSTAGANPARKVTLLALASSLLFAGCSSSPESSIAASEASQQQKKVHNRNDGRYSMANDSAPLRKPTAQEMQDPQVRNDPINLNNSKPYNVLGKDYRPLRDSHGFVEYGTASWYGRKFHGHATSNGETYDMFAMSAAHKTLPLPTYVRVTNLDNQQSAIVRVNDRGPFHGNRVIDLSYSAAYKLGVYQNGTARVKIEALHVDRLPPQKYIQVVALSDKARAKAIAAELSRQFNLPAHTPEENGIIRVRLGPISDEAHAKRTIDALFLKGFERPYILYTAP